MMRYTAGLTHIILYSNIVDIIRVTYIIVCIPVFVIMIVKIITNKIPRPLCARCIFVSIFCIDKQNQCATKNPNRNQIKSAYQFWFIVNCIFFKWTTIILGNRVFLLFKLHLSYTFVLVYNPNNYGHFKQFKNLHIAEHHCHFCKIIQLLL